MPMPSCAAGPGSRVAHGCHQGRTRHIHERRATPHLSYPNQNHMRRRRCASEAWPLSSSRLVVYAHLCYPSSPPRPMGERRTFRVRPTRPRPGVYKAVGRHKSPNWPPPLLRAFSSRPSICSFEVNLVRQARLLHRHDACVLRRGGHAIEADLHNLHDGAATHGALAPLFA